MPRTPNGSLPTYRLHKSSGQAVVTLTDPSGRRRDRLLGPYGSPDSHAEYRRVLAEWEASCRTLAVGATVGATDLTVAELVLRAWDQFVTQHYRDADGQPTNEQNNFRQALAPLLQSHGHTLAREFGPQGLKAVRQAMIDRGWTRKWVNLSIGRIKRLFKWAVSEELIPPTVLQGLQAVEGLSRGRTAAREAEPVGLVADEVVEKTLPHLTRHVAGMVRLQRLTGMRPGEVCRVRLCDIDRAGDVWVFHPTKRKTSHRGKGRAMPSARRSKRCSVNSSRTTRTPSCSHPAGRWPRSMPGGRPPERPSTTGAAKKDRPARPTRSGHQASDTRSVRTATPFVGCATRPGSSRGTRTNFGTRPVRKSGSGTTWKPPR